MDNNYEELSENEKRYTPQVSKLLGLVCSGLNNYQRRRKDGGEIIAPDTDATSGFQSKAISIENSLLQKEAERMRTINEGIKRVEMRTRQRQMNNMNSEDLSEFIPMQSSQSNEDYDLELIEAIKDSTKEVTDMLTKLAKINGMTYTIIKSGFEKTNDSLETMIKASNSLENKVNLILNEFNKTTENIFDDDQFDDSEDLEDEHLINETKKEPVNLFLKKKNSK